MTHENFVSKNPNLSINTITTTNTTNNTIAKSVTVSESTTNLTPHNTLEPNLASNPVPNLVPKVIDRLLEKPAQLQPYTNFADYDEYNAYRNDFYKQLLTAHRASHDSYRHAILTTTITKNPTNLTNPYWQCLVYYDFSAYHIEEYLPVDTEIDIELDIPLQRRVNSAMDIVDKNSAVWSMQRMGQSTTILPDGREILIGGEYEDYYDPHFFIYNDVIVKHPDSTDGKDSTHGSIEIYGYPLHIFPATDFHTATLVGDYIWITGSLGYQDKRQFSQTQVLKLNIHTYNIEPVETVNSMGLVYKHNAEYKDGQIIISDGQSIRYEDSHIIKQIDTWTFNLKTLIWQNITQHQWQVFSVSRKDGHDLHLWEYGRIRTNSSDYVETLTSLQQKLGAIPNLEIFHQLYIPPVEHTLDAMDSDLDYNETAIVIDDVRVLYIRDSYSIIVYVEGILPKQVINVLQENLKHKLEKLENTVCIVEVIEI